jgi:glutamyl-tRNA(Gln) amidotransferase subunit E
MDYKAIGFKAGLEIHQQLDTHKLFCQCQSKISEDAEYTFQRLLRPTQSEMGDVDRAALEESQRKRRFLYTASGTSTCLVEADEEPPHSANEEAIDFVLTMAKLLGSQPVDEIQFMRKIVIDGSNTTGFQRTALVAMNGSLNNVRISTLALEEDAARKLAEKDKLVHYGLDRLGIPLIEITTAADITDPLHAREVAEQLGMMLQSTKKVKRGLGTIRQDLNISIANGARIEVKGIQSLSSLSRVAENEVLRQMGVLEIAETLKKRVKKSDLNHIQSVELSSVFTNSKSKLIQNQLENKGYVKGIRLPGYHGLLNKEHTRLGKDMAVYAGLASGIGGIIHSDEMPGYGFTEQEIAELKTRLQLGVDDAFVLALGNESMVDAALSAVLRRAGMFFDGVPEEVRRSLPDNTTEYMRPLPGAARMYPETDVPPVRITKERVNNIQLPEGLEEKRKRFITQYGLNEESVKQLLSRGIEDDFERLVKQFPDLKNVISRIYLNTFPELENEGIHTERMSDTILIQVLSALQQGKYAKEAVFSILKYLAVHPDTSINDAIYGCGLQSTDEQEIVKVVRKVVSERKAFVKERGEDALGPLMGIVMKELRGKADGKLISKTLHEEIQKVISS